MLRWRKRAVLVGIAILSTRLGIVMLSGNTSKKESDRKPETRFQEHRQDNGKMKNKAMHRSSTVSTKTEARKR